MPDRKKVVQITSALGCMWPGLVATLLSTNTNADPGEGGFFHIACRSPGPQSFSLIRLGVRTAALIERGLPGMFIDRAARPYCKYPPQLGSMTASTSLCPGQWYRQRWPNYRIFGIKPILMLMPYPAACGRGLPLIQHRNRHQEGIAIVVR